MHLGEYCTGGAEPCGRERPRPGCVACSNSLETRRYAGRAACEVLRDEPRSSQSVEFGNLERGRACRDQPRINARSERTQDEMPRTTTYVDAQPPGTLIAVERLHRSDCGAAADRS